MDDPARVQHAWNLRPLSGEQKRYTHINLGLVIPQRQVPAIASVA
jgi:hypothetical protein